MKWNIILLVQMVVLSSVLYVQGQGSFLIEGYTYETGNRGYLSMVNISAIDQTSGQVLIQTMSDVDGKFKLDLPPVDGVELVFDKEMFKSINKKVKNTGEKQFLKIEMERKPGYLFEITLADKKDSINQVVDALTGTLIEVYNNTTEKLVLKLENHPSPEFELPMEKGNHYTILVRKKGYLAKQMEAYVNVKGCILCFEGVSNVRPGVTENLTAGNEYGTLLANVEMDKIFSGKTFEVKNLLYDLNSAALRTESKKELDKVINILRYNPNLMLELGSHTDARGPDESNLKLSKRRANSAVKYITDVGGIPAFRITARGYGESLLKNECADGVQCSEEKHQENRRTEIKVLGIDEEWIFKPLVNIKNEIKMEREIYEMIHGKSDQISEEEYKKLKQLESEQAAAVPSDQILEKVASAKKASDAAFEIKDSSAVVPASVEPAPRPSKERIMEDVVEEQVPLEEVKETSEIKVERKADEKSNKDMGAIDEDKVEKELSKETLEEKAPVAIKEESGIVKGEEVGKGSTITNGFKVIIHYSVVPLPDNHPLFEKHKDMEVYISKEGNRYYMLPGFDSDVKAQEAIDTKYKAVYPGAYVAGFIDGERVY